MTARDYIARSIELMEQSETDDATSLLTEVANSLVVFAAIQREMDPWKNQN